MAQRKKKRTSIRTAAGTAQKAFSERLQALRDDPLRVLPVCPHGEPKQIAKVRAGLEKVAAGKGGFLLRRDKGVVGAVLQSLPMADRESFPRLIDHKVGGQRRFFLQRGHVGRSCMLGVQNHDDPRTLLMAYRSMAKESGLHFFAGDHVTCTGETPRPPIDFINALAAKAGITITADGDDWSCPHTEAPRVRLGFRGGCDLLICAACGKTAGNLHGRLRSFYAGPRERHPVEVDIVIAGRHLDPEPDRVAAYRGGVESEKQLIDPVERAWREESGAASGTRFVLGGRDFGDDQETFLDALGAEGWMRAALAAMTRNGHVGRVDRLGTVLQEHAGDVLAGAEVFLGPDAAAFVAARLDLAPDALLRQAHDEAETRLRTANLPSLEGLGPVGTALDQWARATRRDGRPAGLDHVRRSAGILPDQHRFAMVRALGGDVSIEHALDADARDAGQRLVDAAKTLLEADGEAYRTALETYLERAGAGESVA